MKCIKDIKYSSIGHERQVLDLYLPDDDEFSVFIYFHGGGFYKGDKYFPEVEKYAEKFTSKGIAYVRANYRLYPDASYPDFVKDGAAAVAWVFNHINEYGNCKKIYVGGTSAGAYITMMLNFDRKWLGVHRLTPMDIAGFLHDAGQPTAHFNVLREKGIDYKRIVVDETAPLYYIGMEKEYPPMLHLVSTNDIPGRHAQLNLLLETMKHFEYDMSKVELRVLEGRHSKYSEVKLYDVAIDFIKNN